MAQTKDDSQRAKVRTFSAPDRDHEMLDAIGVSGTPQQVGAALCERNDFADRTMLVLYDETGDPDALTDVVRAAKG